MKDEDREWLYFANLRAGSTRAGSGLPVRAFRNAWNL